MCNADHFLALLTGKIWLIVADSSFWLVHLQADLDVQFLVADVLTHQLAPVPSSSPQPATSDSQPLDTDTQSHRAPAGDLGPDQSSSINSCGQDQNMVKDSAAAGSDRQSMGTPSDSCAAASSYSLCCRDAQPIASVREPTPSQNGRHAATVSSQPPCCSAAPLLQPQAADWDSADGRGELTEGSGAGHWAAAGLQWDLPNGVDAQDCLWLWLGDDDAPALTQLLMTYSRLTSTCLSQDTNPLPDWNLYKRVVR